MCVVYSTMTAWLLLSGQKQQQQLVQTINGQHMFLTASPIDTTETLDTASKPSQPSSSREQAAFHPESLYVIARFNERRCRGMPLYGQDLVEALTVVNAVKPVKSQLLKPGRRHTGGSGHVNALCTVSRDSVKERGPDSHLRHRHSTQALAQIMDSVAHNCKIHSERLLTTAKLPPTVLLSSGFNQVLKAR